MHILVAAGRARRRNDLELTAARRSHLHVLVDTGRRADDTLGVRELVAQRFRAAAADRRGLALDVRRARDVALGGRIAVWLCRRPAGQGERYRGDRNCGDLGCDAHAASTSLWMPLQVNAAVTSVFRPLRSTARCSTRAWRGRAVP